MADEPEPHGTAPETTSAERVETAVSPVIRAEAVSIPTPAWGVAVPEDVETVEAEIVDTGDVSTRSAHEDMPEREWGLARRQWPGWVALLLAISTAVLTAIAVAVDGQHQPVAATLLAWVAIGCSVAAFLVGVVAAVLGRGRVAGVIAALVGVFSNPWLLLQVLTLLKG